MLISKLFFKNIALLIIIINCSSCVDKRGKTQTVNEALSKESLISVSNTLVGQPELNFSIHEGKIYNKFFRQGNVAAHTVLTAGTEPRLVVAFPAGNSGVSLWFESVNEAIQWQEIHNIKAITQTNSDDEMLYGVQAELISSAKKLTVKKAILSSVRVIRDYLQTSDVPDIINNEVTVKGNVVTWYRDRLDGIGGYKLQVKVLQGTVTSNKDETVVFKAENNLPLKIEVRALTGDKPLTPIPKEQLLITNKPLDSLDINILAFLSYQEKLLAGTWRFATYFGRDTLMSTRLLMPILRPVVIEAALGSVIERINSYGEVAHEEDIGEFAIIRHLREGEKENIKPIYDYKMIDDNYLLAPVIARYLIKNVADKQLVATFMNKKTASGLTYGERLVNNFYYVLKHASAYAKHPVFNNLIKIKDGLNVGDWRDSGEGLGFGKVPYNVNAVFVPAALLAISSLYESGILSGYLHHENLFKEAKNIAQIWKEKANKHFKVTIKNQIAKDAVRGYAKKIGVSQTEAINDIANQDVTFNAVSLSADGQAVPVINSDEGFALLFLNPSEQELERIITTVLSPYPAGLLTPIGLLVSNPIYANEKLQQHFTPSHYHGEVVWSWQQALFVAGLEQQLLRTDLSKRIQLKLRKAQVRLWQVIHDVRAMSNAELWSWSYHNGKYQIESFGQRSSDKTESNAAQLWSTVYLAIANPNAL